MILVVLEPEIIQGRLIGQAQIAQVRGIIAEHGSWSRRRVSEHLAELWEWRSAVTRRDHRWGNEVKMAN